MAPSSNDSSSNSKDSSSNSNSTPSNSGNGNSGGSNNNNNNNNSGSNNSNNSGNNNGNNNSGGNSNSGNNNGNNSGNNSSGGNGNSGGDNGNKDSSGKDNSSGNNNSGQNNNSSGQNSNSGQNNNNNNSGQNNNNNSGQNGNNNSGQNNNNQNNNNGNQNNNGNSSGQNNNNSSGQNNNNNGGNNNSQSSQGNRPPPPPPPPPPKSSNWHAPPPPLQSKKSPPTSTAVANKSSPSSSSPSPLIIGLASGAGLLLVVALLFFACSRRKKKRQSSHLMDNPDPYRANGAGSEYWQSGAYKSNEHIMNMPPPPLPGWSSGPAVHHPPMPPMPPMISSEMNSSNFSGPHGPLQPPPHPSVALGFNTSTFTYDDLAVATSGFSQAKLLGQGGFGFVHKGVLPNGKEIAVKSLKSGSGQGDREFAAEVEIISRVHHRHLVSLVGYCLNGERKLLVYEFVPNNNLEFHLYNKNRPPLDWASRVKIALGSAKGLAYLHEDCHPKIIHRDIKAANILIDHHYEAKVADFGLAKLNQENVTHVSTRVMGTFGYLAPEYASSGKLTEKSDVFSFGIMLLELITGRRPVDTTGEYEEDTLVDWARPLLVKAIEDGNYSELADPRLENKYDHEGMARMVACASTSVRHSAKKRPKMSQIVRVLEGDVSLEDLHEGIKPSPSALFGGSNTSSDFDSDSYNANMKNFRKSALGESQDYPSSDYGNTSNSEEMTKKI